MGDSSTAYNALSGTQAVTCELGPGTYRVGLSKYGFALATDLKQGDVIYLSCHIALKSVTGLNRLGFEPVINGQYARCWLANPTGDFDGIITKSYTVSADVPAGTNLLQAGAYIQPFQGKTFTVADGGYVRVDHLMMSIGQPAAWAPAEGETLTADGGGGGMTEPTNLVKTQPDENAVQTIAGATPATNKWRIWSRLDGTAQDSTTDYHIAATINPDAQIAAGAIGLNIKYIDSSGADNWPRSASIASAIPANAWTRVEGTVTLPAGMTPDTVSIWWPSNATDMHFRACNLVVYPLAGGRIVRARGTAAGYISKAKEATVLYTPSKSARQVRVILLDETGSSIYDIQSVAIVADAEELQGKVAAQESSIQTIQSDMTTVQSGLSGLNVRLASMQTELAGVSAGDVLYQVPYTVSGGKATFTAAVYKSGVECHTSYDPSCFTWYLKSEAGTVKIGTGYSVTVNVSDVGYGGFIVGVFETQ